MSHERIKELPGPRQPPLYFAGRRAEIDSLRKALATLCTSSDPSNGIELFTGVPGAGKTQLANEYAKRVTGETHSGRTVHAVAIDPRLLNDEVRVFLMLAKGLGNPAVGEAVVNHGGRTGTLPELLSNSLGAGMWRGKALVAVIDELQRMEPAGMATLHVLHRGAHGCPIQLIGFGLPNTPAVLAAPGDGVAGVSSVAKRTALEPLGADEACDALVGTLAALGFGPNFVPDASVRQLAAASLGFPQYIRGYLEGAIAAIGKHGGLEEGIALSEALAYGDRKHREHYAEQLQTAGCCESMFALDAAMDRLGTPKLWRDEALDALRSAGHDPADLEAAEAWDTCHGRQRPPLLRPAVPPRGAQSHTRQPALTFTTSRVPDGAARIIR